MPMLLIVVTKAARIEIVLGFNGFCTQID